VKAYPSAAKLARKQRQSANRLRRAVAAHRAEQKRKQAEREAA
jgi:hypothetical protein